MKSHRMARVAEAVREVAAETILFELKDPRVRNVTVTRAEVSADLQNAKVYVSILGTEKQQALAMHGLEHASGFVQSKLAKRLAMRFTPMVLFVKDEGVKKSLEVARILAEEKARRGEVANAGGNVEDEPDEADTESNHPSDEA